MQPRNAGVMLFVLSIASVVAVLQSWALDETPVMRWSYDPVQGIDTTVVWPDDPRHTVITSFRIAPDGSVWILQQGVQKATLRRFAENAGEAALVEHIDLPTDAGWYVDGLKNENGVFLCIQLHQPTRQAGFLQVTPTGITIVDLPRDLGYNRDRKGRSMSPLGRLSEINGAIYLNNPRFNSAVRIATTSLLPSIGSSDIRAGTPVGTGSLVYQDGPLIKRDGQTILDLGLRGGSLEDVLLDGTFIIHRGGGFDPSGTLFRNYDTHEPNGSLVRSTNVRDTYGMAFKINGSAYAFTPEAVYMLRPEAGGVTLYRY